MPAPPWREGNCRTVLYTGLTREEHNSCVPRTGGLIVLLAAVAAAAVHAQPGSAAPGSLLQSLFGESMVRAEVIVQEGSGVRDLRVDRGRVRTLSERQVRLLERDGTLVNVPIAANASITTKGAQATFAALRPGMHVTTVREHEQPAQFVVNPAQALPKALTQLLFGPSMIRAEVIIRDGSERDVRVDHGQIVALRARVVRLRESDGRLVSLPVAASATITLDGRKAPWKWLRAGMSATVLRDGDGPASVLEASAAGG
jgi:hypothetical protein